MLLYYLFWIFVGFNLHFYIIFGTNLLTGGPTQIVVFLPISVFRRKEYQTSPNGMKPLGELFFGTEAIQDAWSRRRGSFEEATRQGGAPYPPGRALHPRGPLMAPLTDFFCLYISIYPKMTGEHNRSGVPPPEASVATESQPRPVPAPCRRGNPFLVAIFIIPVLSMTRRE